MGGYPLLLADSSLLLPDYASQERELTRRLAEQLALHEHGQFKMVKLSELQVRNPSISCDPLPSSAIMYHPLPSLCHPLPSSAILCHHVPSSAIPVRSSAILCHPLPSCHSARVLEGVAMPSGGSRFRHTGSEWVLLDACAR